MKRESSAAAAADQLGCSNLKPEAARAPDRPGNSGKAR
jgi:hypothetical protein